MDLRQMEVAVAVAEAGGFTAAAQRLNVVQSAVSSTVRALERELGTPLFDRTTHRVSLTPAGEAFVPAARAALRAAEQVRAAVDVVQGQQLRGRITVGTMQGVWADLHRPLAALRAEHPGVVVRLRQAAVTDIRQALREGTVDLAVVALRVALPHNAPTTTIPYAHVLRSTVRLVRTHPVLVRRGLYQAAMFGAFSAFWTTISYVLTGPHFDYSPIGVGLFALVGAAGAAVAPFAGHWADRGLTRPMTGVALAVAAVAFALAGFGGHHIVLLAPAAVLLDMGVQTSLILGQHTIYQLDPDARARLNSAFIATFFIGGALGSELASVAYHLAGWTAVTALGTALPVLALLYWTSERRAPSVA